MSSGDPGDPGDTVAAAGERRRLAEVFGDVLPDGPPEDDPDVDQAADRRDAQLRHDVPPHHGS